MTACVHVLNAESAVQNSLQRNYITVANLLHERTKQREEVGNEHGFVRVFRVQLECGIKGICCDCRGARETV